MSNLQIVTTPDGRALQYGENTAPLPALATDATVHAYAVPEGVWVGVQQPGEPRPVYPGAGGTRLGSIELPADPDAAAAAELARAKADKRAELWAHYDAGMGAVLAEYPDAETKTWDRQESEARAWQADNTAPTPLLDALAASRQMDKGELVQRVIAKADAWLELSGTLTGKRQRLAEAVDAAGTVAEVQAVTWESA